MPDDIRTNDRPPASLYTALLDVTIAVTELAGNDPDLCADARRLPVRQPDGSWRFDAGDWHLPRAAYVLTALRAVRWIAEHYDDRAVLTFVGDVETDVHATWDRYVANLTPDGKPA